jgi:hypothetical protein
MHKNRKDPFFDTYFWALAAIVPLRFHNDDLIFEKKKKELL